mmetsp:Transcript_10004/g.28430  ORF Transcript_10004/g.28430 Transcript_10004/m.28430 type:complete len:257 (-) Transcript_10004:217-987(-)
MLGRVLQGRGGENSHPLFPRTKPLHIWTDIAPRNSGYARGDSLILRQQPRTALLDDWHPLRLLEPVRGNLRHFDPVGSRISRHWLLRLLRVPLLEADIRGQSSTRQDRRRQPRKRFADRHHHSHQPGDGDRAQLPCGRILDRIFEHVLRPQRRLRRRVCRPRDFTLVAVRSVHQGCYRTRRVHDELLDAPHIHELRFQRHRDRLSRIHRLRVQQGLLLPPAHDRRRGHLLLRMLVAAVRVDADQFRFSQIGQAPSW